MTDSTSSGVDFDVAIVGYGPVGALSALLLAAADLRVVILERSVDPLELPRAVGLDGESVRMFQRIGYGSEVANLLQPPREREEIHFTNSKHESLFAVPFVQFGSNGWRDIAFFDQPELEVLLRDFVSKEKRIEVRMGREVTQLTQDDDGVDLDMSQVESPANCSVRASWVLGCDGASSFVRRAAGIGWTSLGYDQDWLVLDITQKPEAELPLYSMQVCDPARLVSYICVKDPNRRWELQLLPGETREEMEKPEKIRELLQPWLPPEHYDIRRAAVYQFHAATATQWRERRVLLAGDAAHQTPPFMGQGLNAGFRDAANLGWKLPVVLSGTCGAELLDSYGDERDAHARDVVVKAVGLGKLMEIFAAKEAGLPNPYAADESDSFGNTGIPPLRDGAFILDQIAPEGPAGRLLKQPRVRRPEGGICLLDELLGNGFAVVARKRADLVMSETSEAIIGRLGGKQVCLEDIEVVEGELDRALDQYSAVVVRPDRHIFGVVDSDRNIDGVIGELGRKMLLVAEKSGD
jgi:3-(3-hydroxy-phenyl)propionate hydroxylase